MRARARDADAAPAADRTVYAIVIGHNAAPPGRDDLETLRFADDDAVRMHALLERVSDKTVLLTELDGQTRFRHGNKLPAQAPTVEALQAAVADVRRRVHQAQKQGGEATLFFVYSGHGGFDSDGLYMALADGWLTSERLLERLLAGFDGVQVHLLIDPHDRPHHLEDEAAFELDAALDRVSATEHALQAVFPETLSADLDLVGAFVAPARLADNQEWPEARSGVFVHAVASGLLGAADVNGDLRIEYGELDAFIAAAHSDLGDGDADQPGAATRPPKEGYSAVLVDLARARDVRWLSGDASQLGHFHVELENGVRLLDAHLGWRLRAALALPRDEVAFVVNQEGEARVASNAPQLVHFGSLQLSPARRSVAGIAPPSAHDRLFQTSFTRAYYERFAGARGVSQAWLGAPRPLPTDGPPKPVAPPDRHRRLRLGLWSTAGAMAAATVVSAGFALAAGRQFRDTPTRREAFELDQRARRSTNVAISAGVLTAAAAVAGWWYRPRPTRSFAVGGHPLSWGARW